MSFNIINPLYPQPALAVGGTSYLTSQVTSVTAGATTVTGFAGTTTQSQVQLVYLDIAGDDVRVYWEGSTPTSSTGHVLTSKVGYMWAANRYNNSKFILSGTGTASTITASPFNGG
jgi:hypothetical protein